MRFFALYSSVVSDYYKVAFFSLRIVAIAQDYTMTVLFPITRELQIVADIMSDVICRSSYTHTTEYKRQVKFLTRLRFVCWRASFSAKVSCHGWKVASRRVRRHP